MKLPQVEQPSNKPTLKIPKDFLNLQKTLLGGKCFSQQELGLLQRLYAQLDRDSKIEIAGKLINLEAHLKRFGGEQDNEDLRKWIDDEFNSIKRLLRPDNLNNVVSN